MGHQLNIKSDEAYRLASELAALKGESLTEAVTASLRERLERERRVGDQEERAQDVMRLAAELQAHVEGPLLTNEELDTLLYDPRTGLPR
ncbi:type II toxin-antitoxin system VapB family antitoxin [Elioraea sp.]|uniref:type II toxin-antitoxin system VapB family antitoxin n=1 Tax=Elioraea sp. TaxID=2185103 RepID=UPI003F72153E